MRNSICSNMIFVCSLVIVFQSFLSSDFSQGGNDTSQNEHIIGQNSGRRQYTLFQGHSGPVYAATFSVAGDFLLSSSADKTSMLIWSQLNDLLFFPDSVFTFDSLLRCFTFKYEKIGYTWQTPTITTFLKTWFFFFLSIDSVKYFTLTVYRN